MVLPVAFLLLTACTALLIRRRSRAAAVEAQPREEERVAATG
jgi:outer membrane biogenesis lipoprotein LolB